MRKFIFLALTSCALFAGQSAIVTSGTSGTSIPIPNFANSQSTRIEFQLHNFTTPGSALQIWSLTGTGIDAQLDQFGNLNLGDARDSTSGTGAPVQASLIGRTNVLARLTRDIPNLLLTLEVWNYDGTGYASEQFTITALNSWTFSGGNLGTASGDIAFLRIFTTLVPIGSKPPVTANVGNAGEWKFDGTLADASGLGQTITWPGVTYTATPNQLAFAFPKTFGAPPWSNWTSLRAGYPNQLDGTSSYSLADASAAVTYYWTQLTGPSTAVWASRTASQPTISALVFGTYGFQLTVADVNANTSSVALQTGAVPYSNQGVVIPANPAVSQYFGPMIAFGQNPYGYMDERQMTMVNLQGSPGGAVYSYGTSQTWTTPGSGTVSYPFAGKGPAPGQTCTTLTGNITATSTSIPIANASCLSLSVLPTMILIGNSLSVFGSVQEMVRICATTATSGAATLTVCYDGRGVQGLTTSFATAQPGSHTSGDTVGEYKVTGTSTHFITDSTRPLCPAGVGQTLTYGPPGAVSYSTGTVTLSAGTTAVTGSSTLWAGNVFGGNTLMLRVNATHSGTPYVLVRLITTVTSNTAIVLNGAVPSDTDNGPFTYEVLTPRYASLSLTDPTGSPLKILQNAMWCESDTSAYMQAAHDIGAFDTTTYSGMNYSYKDSLGSQSATGPNFYGPGGAIRNFYFRSGWTPALTTANLIDEIWISDPEICNGWCTGASPLLQGGGVTSAMLDLQTNPNTALTWPQVRQFAVNGSALGASGCNDYDTRDSAVLESWVGLPAIWDPNPTYQAMWQTAMTANYNREVSTVNAITGQPCKQTNNSWANGQLWSPNIGPLNVTHNSATVTGTGLASSVCNGITGGTAALTTGIITITAATGTFVAGAQIIITGTMGGQPYTFRTGFVLNSGSSVSLGGQWPGDAGTFAWEIASDQNISTIGRSNDDPDLQQNYTCVWNNSGQITLNTPYVGATDTAGDKYMYTANLAGYGQGSFLLAGWKEFAFYVGSQNPNSTIASNYKTLGGLAAGFVQSTAYDSYTQGINYGTIFQSCVPNITASTQLLMFRSNGCQFGAGAIETARAINGEGTSNALSFYYASNPTSTYPVTAYGSIWGNCALTRPGFYCDSNYVTVNDELSNANLAGTKWPGFYWNIGNASQWPAIFGGGIPAATPQTAYVGFHFPTGAVAAAMTDTAPNGSMAVTNCSSTPCSVTMDTSQGNHLLQVQYKNSGGAVTATGYAQPILFITSPRIGQLVALGDSLTAGWYNSLNDPYPYKLSDLLNMPRSRSYDLGVAGYRTDQVNTNELPTALSLYNATLGENLALYWAGINDCLQSISLSTAEANINTAISALHAIGYKTMVLDLTPQNYNGTMPPEPGTCPAFQIALNAYIMSGSTGADVAVDVNTLPNLQNTANGTYFYMDRLHIQDPGYIDIANAVLPLVP